MTLTRVTALDGDTILPLADAKLSAHITNSSDDAVLTGFRDAALAHIERLAGVSLASGTWRWAMRSFPARVDLPMRPVTALGTVTYYDADGASQTYADARLIDGSAYPAVNDSWPTAYDYAAIEFTAGPPSDEQLAILIAAAQIQFQIFENRGRDDQKYIEGMERAVSSVLGTLTQVLV